MGIDKNRDGTADASAMVAGRPPRLAEAVSWLIVAALLFLMAAPAQAGGFHTLVRINPLSGLTPPSGPATGERDTQVKIESLQPYRNPSALPPEKTVPEEESAPQESEPVLDQSSQEAPAEGVAVSQAEVLYNQARFDVIGREYGAALEKLRKAAELEPDNPRILALKARVAKYLGHGQEALEDYQRVAGQPEADPGLGFEEAALLTGLGRTGEALARYRSLEEVDRFRSFKGQAEILIKQWRFSKTVDLLSGLDQFPPLERQELLYLKGKAYYWNARYEEALAALSQAESLGPESGLAGKIREMQASVRRDDKGWYAGVSATLLYDSDVYVSSDYSQPANAVTSGHSDGAVQADLWAGARLFRYQGFALGATFQAQQVNYFDQTYANWTYFAPGLYLSRTTTEWGFRLPYAFYYYYSSADLEDNVAIHSLNPSIYWQMTPKFMTQVYGSFQVKEFFENDSDSIFYSVGAGHKLTLNKNTNYLSLYYQYSVEDHEDDQSGHQGFEATLSAGYQLIKSVNLYGSLTAAYYDYQVRPEWTLDYAVVDRNDLQIRVYTQISWQIIPSWYLNLGYNFVWNDSNVSGDGINPYDYSKSTVALRVTKTF